MTSLLQHTGWLLAPGPREDLRYVGWATMGLLAGVLFTALGLFALYKGAPMILWVLFSGPIFAMEGVLHALPPRRRRVELGVRAAITLFFLAVILSIPLTYPLPLRVDSFPVWVAGLLILFLLCRKYFVNRHRERRSRPAE
jgi:hypothetical protein